LWQKECAEEWILVSPNKKCTDHALRVLKQRPSASALKKNVAGVQRCLSFAAILDYPACTGYEYPASQLLKKDLIDAGYVCTQLGNKPKVVFAASLSPPPLEIQFGSVSTPPRVQSADQRHERENSNLVSPNLDSPSSSGPIDSGPLSPAQDADFQSMLDDMVDRVWTCQRCLSFSHSTKECVGKIRCKSCYRYGHEKKDCWKKPPSMRWVAKILSKTDNLVSRADGQNAIIHVLNSLAAPPSTAHSKKSLCSPLCCFTFLRRGELSGGSTPIHAGGLPGAPALG
jgi:hypothetical protein